MNELRRSSGAVMLMSRCKDFESKELGMFDTRCYECQKKAYEERRKENERRKKSGKALLK